MKTSAAFWSAKPQVGWKNTAADVRLQTISRKAH
jgi:hypothetical protein